MNTRLILTEIVLIFKVLVCKTISRDYIGGYSTAPLLGLTLSLIFFAGMIPKIKRPAIKITMASNANQSRPFLPTDASRSVGQWS